MTVDRSPTEHFRRRLADLTVAGRNLTGFASGPQPEARAAFRKQYLSWHDEITKALADLGMMSTAIDEYRNVPWQMIAGDQVSHDEIVRTILSDIAFKVGRLEALMVSSEPPERVIPDPTTVGVAVFDATALFAKHTRYLLLGFAVHGVVQARWSARLLEETAANLAGKLRGDSLEDLGRFIKTETDLIRDGLVSGYEHRLPGLSLPDAGDLHVLAAAIESGATTIVTDNLRDFPSDALDPWGILAVEPDAFLLQCIDANPVLAVRLVQVAPDPERLLAVLDDGVPETAARLRALVS